MYQMHAARVQVAHTVSICHHSIWNLTLQRASLNNQPVLWSDAHAHARLVSPLVSYSAVYAWLSAAPLLACGQRAQHVRGVKRTSKRREGAGGREVMEKSDYVSMLMSPSTIQSASEM
jgi:hypothetical protein